MVLVGLHQAGNDTEIRPRPQIPRVHSMSRRREHNWLNLPRVWVLEQRCVDCIWIADITIFLNRCK